MEIKNMLINLLKWFYDLTKARERERIKDSLIVKLTNELNGFRKQIDYSFIPDGWNEVKEKEVTTNKTFLDGIQLDLDIRDLFNSTIYSRRLARDIIEKEIKEDNQDQYFNNLMLRTANLILILIKYKTNKAQFNVTDRWNNGDTALATGYGDCDLSARAFVRVANDVLDELKMYEYKKYIFQSIGFMGKVGHSWAAVYDPIDKIFKLIESTQDNPYQKLPDVPVYYDLYFCLNFKKIWWKNNRWRQFL